MEYLDYGLPVTQLMGIPVTQLKVPLWVNLSVLTRLIYFS